MACRHQIGGDADASSATPMADAMTTAQRSHTRSTAGGSPASNVLTPEADGSALRCRLA